MLSQRHILEEGLEAKLAGVAKESGGEAERVAVEQGRLLGDWDALARGEWDKLCPHRNENSSLDGSSPELGLAVPPAPPEAEAASPFHRQASIQKELGGVLEQNESSDAPSGRQEVVENGRPGQKRRQEGEGREDTLAKRSNVSGNLTAILLLRRPWQRSLNAAPTLFQLLSLSRYGKGSGRLLGWVALTEWNFSKERRMPS